MSVSFPLWLVSSERVCDVGKMIAVCHPRSYRPFKRKRKKKKLCFAFEGSTIVFTKSPFHARLPLPFQRCFPKYPVLSVAAHWANTALTSAASVTVRLPLCLSKKATNKWQRRGSVFPVDPLTFPPDSFPERYPRLNSKQWKKNLKTKRRENNTSLVREAWNHEAMKPWLRFINGTYLHMGLAHKRTLGTDTAISLSLTPTSWRAPHSRLLPGIPNKTFITRHFSAAHTLRQGSKSSLSSLIQAQDYNRSRRGVEHTQTKVKHCIPAPLSKYWRTAD